MSRLQLIVQEFFCDLHNAGLGGVILHHFEFEDGGDIDFCVNSRGLHLFLEVLRSCLGRREWDVIQVLEHEQSGAYVVCGPAAGSGDFLLLDYCEDYRIRGHVVLQQDEMLKDQRDLSWGGNGASELVELSYRFVKAAAKKKDPSGVRKDLEDLWVKEEMSFRAWLKDRWGLRMETWTDSSVEEALSDLQSMLKKRRWSLGELRLKLNRFLSPRGLLVECGQEDHEKLKAAIAPCFRKVETEPSSLRGVMGSTLILVRPGRVRGLRKWILNRMDCWLEASSGPDVGKFLVKRTASYHGWEQDV